MKLRIQSNPNRINQAMSNPDETTPNPSLNDDATKTSLINSFAQITSATPQESLFFLESHQWDLDAALSTFLDDAPRPATHRPPQESSPEYSPSQSPSRSRSRSGSPEEEVGRRPYALRSGGKNKRKVEGRGGIRTLADLNRTPDGNDDDDDDDDEVQEYYTGGEKSGMLVQDPTNRYDADAIFDHAKNSGSVLPTDRPSSSSRSFTGTARLLSGESVNVSAQPPETVTHTITLWRNGFTVNDSPLRRFDDPANASFLERIKNSECPRELEPADRRTKVHLDLMRRDEDYSEPKKHQSKVSFQGVGRTLGSSSDSADPAASNPSAPSSLMTAPSPTSGLVIDSSLPTTSIQLRLSDGTRMVSRFNLNHTIRDMRAFIDASRPGGARNYQLQTMGFPPKPLSNLDQTIEEAGIANSVVIQKF